MAEIEELMGADHENAPVSLRILGDFSPELADALETAASMYDTFSRCITGRVDDRHDLQTLEACANERGEAIDELAKLIGGDEGIAPVLIPAKEAWQRIRARRIRLCVFLLLQRQYMWGATDLLRMRVTPARGYARQQAESVGLLALMRDNPTLANRWFLLTIEGRGRSFFNETQGAVKEELRRVELHSAYDLGSESALHVRPASIVRTLSFVNRVHEGRVQEGISLGYQEYNPDDSFLFLLETLFFLRTQERIFKALGSLFPEVDDPIWLVRVRLFGETIERMWQQIERMHPDRCERYREMGR